ncbi:MAG: helix-turn-helix transcriptional regulator [Hyphomicrobiales bacterium]
MSVSVATLSGWNESIAEAIASINSNSFPEKLQHALSKLVDFDICMIFSYSQVNPSRSLFHNLDASQAKIIIDDYLAGPYLLDPFYSATTKGKRKGFGAMRTLAPDQFYRSEFYRHHYVRTGISDEIGIFFPISSNSTAVLSIARRNPKKLFTEREKKIFSSVASFLERFAHNHWSKHGKTDSSARQKSTIESVFDSFGLGVITAREKEIVTLVLRGHSSGSIGQVLGISEGTVKIHRKNAYDKLKISSQAELFSMFLASLSKQLST